MKRHVVLLMAALLLALSGCGVKPSEVVLRNAVVAANGARISIETAETSALTLYRAEQEAVLTRARAGKLTQQEALARIGDIRERWDPVADALAAARAAHAALVTAIQAFETGEAIVLGGERVSSSIEEVAARARALRDAYDGVSDALSALRSPRGPL